MKKFVLLFCFFISISCLAQQRHLTFMGIPIDGTINTFEAKLKSKGMLPNTKQTNHFLLEKGCSEVFILDAMSI